jgi:hypothetical protein
LEQFDFEIKYQPGSKMIISDALSRAPQMMEMM